MKFIYSLLYKKGIKSEMSIANIPSESKQVIGEKIDDASVTPCVNIALLPHLSTSVFKTGGETNNGVVTLSGHTSSSDGKDMASKVGSDVNGVINVVNNMSIDDSLSGN